MKKPNVTQILNKDFTCPGCQTSGNWHKTARPKNRANSTIYRLKCGRCGEEIVAKVPRSGSNPDGARLQARKEYRTLCELQFTFPQSAEYGTLTPLGYLEPDALGVMITRLFNGENLIRQARVLGFTRPSGVFYSAGVWLRKLHDSCPRGYQFRTLDVEGKIGYLERRYGAVWARHGKLHVICERFKERAANIKSIPVRTTWSHGDFKPENVLCDGHKYVALDMQLENYGAFVYDLASFLNHLHLASLGIPGYWIRRDYPQAEKDFLAGYGGLGEQEMSALRWAQLYFALCYFGAYQQRSPIAAIYANWKMRPLANKLAAQL